MCHTYQTCRTHYIWKWLFSVTVWLLDIRSYGDHCMSTGRMTTVLVKVSIPAQTSWARSKLGRKGFIWLILPYCCSSPKEVRTGTQAGQEAGAVAEAMEGCSLLACFPWLAQACSLIELKTTSPEMVPPTRGLSPLITNWENALQLDLMEAFPQLKLLSLW